MTKQYLTRPALQTDRRYELEIGNFAKNEGLLIKDLQILFDVQLYADNTKTANSAIVEVYNLSRATLARLEDDYTYCRLAVGYRETGIQSILTGNVTRVVTRKQGPDVITQLFMGESYSDLHHQRLKSVVAPGKTMEDVIEEIRKQMPGVARGAYVSPKLSNPVLYGYPLNGSPNAMLQRLCRELGWEYRIYLGALHITDENGITEKDTSNAIPINDGTGLIGIPYYVSASVDGLPTNPQRASGIRFTALLNPSIIPGNLIQLESSVLPRLNGYYRANAVRYTGDYRGNDWVMEVSCSQLVK